MVHKGFPCCSWHYSHFLLVRVWPFLVKSKGTHCLAESPHTWGSQASESQSHSWCPHCSSRPLCNMHLSYFLFSKCAKLWPVAVLLPAEVTEVVPEVLQLCLDLPGAGHGLLLGLQVVVILAPLQQLVILLAVNTLTMKSELVPGNWKYDKWFRDKCSECWQGWSNGDADLDVFCRRRSESTPSGTFWSWLSSQNRFWWKHSGMPSSEQSKAWNWRENSLLSSLQWFL